MRVPRVIVHPTVEPIGLPEARLHLRLDAYDSPATHPDDPLITALITAARQWAENFTGRTIAQATLELALDEFPGYDGYSSCNMARYCRPRFGCSPSGQLAYLYDVIELPRGPVQSVLSVDYTDATESPQDQIAGYQIDIHSDPARLMPLADASWPTITNGFNAVKVRYVAGYTLPGDSPDTYPLPMAIKQAMLLMIGDWYENREDTSAQKMEHIPRGAEALLRQYRLEKALA